MPSTIPVAHDFNCPWCWIGLFHARRLQEEFGVGIEWRGFELYPDGLPWPEAPAKPLEPENKPRVPGRLALALAAEGMELPEVPRPRRMRTHAAHEAVEYAKTEGCDDALVERLYRAYWEQGLDLRDPAVLAHVAKGVVKNIEAMLDAVRDRRFAANLVGFDEPAYGVGVYHVPTFFVGDERLAEQPYAAIAAAMRRAGHQGRPVPTIYGALSFAPPPSDRPVVFVNMVSTIDGKTVTGSRNEPVGDLGSPLDHMLMRRIEAAADAVMVGAGSLRSTPGLWYRPELRRVVVTRSGRLDYDTRFFTDAPEQAVVAAPEGAEVGAPAPVEVWRGGRGGADLAALLAWLRAEKGVDRLVVEGGSDLNAAVLSAGLVDELFLTVSPKIKLGADTPTYAGGVALPREAVQRYAIVEQHRVGDELFVRYRRVQEK